MWTALSVLPSVTKISDCLKEWPFTDKRLQLTHFRFEFTSLAILFVFKSLSCSYTPLCHSVLMPVYHSFHLAFSSLTLKYSFSPHKSLWYSLILESSRAIYLSDQWPVPTIIVELLCPIDHKKIVQLQKTRSNSDVNENVANNNLLGCKMQHFKPLWKKGRKEEKKEVKVSPSEAICLFALYSKKSSDNPYLKICNFSK